MAKRKTHDKFIEEVTLILGTEYEVLSQYVNAKTKIKMRHSCGEIYEATPDKIISRGDGCPGCKGDRFAKKMINKASTHFSDKFTKLSNGEYELLSEYRGLSKYITVKHIVCNHIYKVRAGNFSSGRKCPKCMEVQRRVSRRTDVNIINKRIYDKFENRIRLAGTYNGYNEHSEFICSDCDFTFTSSVASLLNANVKGGCPSCTTSNSFGEVKIKEYLSQKGVLFESQYTFSDLAFKNPLRFDYAVFKEENADKPTLLIEFDGRQHYEPVEFFGGVTEFEKVKMRDSLKDSYCKRCNIKLLRIPYWEFDNIERILESEVS
jgi:hypothetical protein